MEEFKFGGDLKKRLTLYWSNIGKTIKKNYLNNFF